MSMGSIRIVRVFSVIITCDAITSERSSQVQLGTGSKRVTSHIEIIPESQPKGGKEFAKSQKCTQIHDSSVPQSDRILVRFFFSHLPTTPVTGRGESVGSSDIVYLQVWESQFNSHFSLRYYQRIPPPPPEGRGVRDRSLYPFLFDTPYLQSLFSVVNQIIQTSQLIR